MVFKIGNIKLISQVSVRFDCCVIASVWEHGPFSTLRRRHRPAFVELLSWWGAHYLPWNVVPRSTGLEKSRFTATPRPRAQA